MDYSVATHTTLKRPGYEEVGENGNDKPSLPYQIFKLNELDQHLLNDCYGRCNSMDKVSKETDLEPSVIYQRVDNAWREFDMKERQQFLYYWSAKNE